ncbi:MAG: sigma-70 family RNA polymerase sigma factor [Muribaculaceae bacterium]|nr:sigma-70 family RNA polymerase sigma factor [Muribaculaceae bacterium]
MKGPEQAFELLVKEYKSTIYSICYMFAQNKAEADDLFQEALINLWQGSCGFRGESSLKSWVYRVTLNTCISYKRKKKITTVDIDIAPDAFSEESAEGRQTRMLHDRISQLGPMDRAIILLWLENMPYDEIGAIVGMNAKAIGVRLVRIKEKLKKISNPE